MYQVGSININSINSRYCSLVELPGTSTAVHLYTTAPTRARGLPERQIWARIGSPHLFEAERLVGDLK